jgi:hypothetical protein
VLTLRARRRWRVRAYRAARTGPAWLLGLPAVPAWWLVSAWLDVALALGVSEEGRRRGLRPLVFVADALDMWRALWLLYAERRRRASLGSGC